MAERERVIVEMDSEDVGEFKKVIGQIPRYRLVEFGNDNIQGVARPDSHFKPVEEMNWGEELLEIKTLFTDVLNAQIDGNPIAANGFNSMLRSWQMRLARIGVAGLRQDILKELLIQRMNDSVTAYEKFDKRPGSYRKDKTFVYQEFMPNFSPREFRTGIFYYGLDGKEALSMNLIGEKESVKSPQHLVTNFTNRNMWNFKNSLRQAFPHYT